MKYKELDFFNAEEITSNAKCTIHKSGKLGFSMDAIKLMEIDKSNSISIAKGPDFNETGNLYAVVNRNETDGAFKIIKAGAYYYLNTKSLFNQLEYPFQHERIMFDVVQINSEEGNKLFKLTRRALRKK